jgi:hypothetical protein
VNAPHPNLSAQVVARLEAEIAEFEATIAELGPREALAEAVTKARAAHDAKSARIAAQGGIPKRADYVSGRVEHHPALAGERHALRVAQEALRQHDDATRKLANRRTTLFESGSSLDRPFKCHAAPSETGRVAQEGRGRRLEFNQETREFRIVRTGTEPVKVCEVDGPQGVAKRRAASRARGN